MTDTEFWANEHVQHLPASLQEKLYHGNADMFVSACNQGVIVFEDGRWISRFRFTSTLSFLCGRCFCGDRVVGRKLIKGENYMPVRELERLFDVENLKVALKKYRENRIPDCCKNLDNLLNKSIGG